MVEEAPVNNMAASEARYTAPSAKALRATTCKRRGDFIGDDEWVCRNEIVEVNVEILGDKKRYRK